MHCDITDPMSLRDVGECDYIVHAAALLGVQAVRQAPVRTLRVNFDGTRAVLDYARTLPDLKRCLVLSSSEVYGEAADGKAVELSGAESG